MFRLIISSCILLSDFLNFLMQTYETRCQSTLLSTSHSPVISSLNILQRKILLLKKNNICNVIDCILNESIFTVKSFLNIYNICQLMNELYRASLSKTYCMYQADRFKGKCSVLKQGNIQPNVPHIKIICLQHMIFI